MANSIRQRVDAILKEATGRDLSSNEKHKFLPSIRDYTRPLSPKQESWLLSIEARLGLIHDENSDPDEEDEDDNLLQPTDSYNGHPF